MISRAAVAGMYEALGFAAPAPPPTWDVELSDADVIDLDLLPIRVPAPRARRGGPSS